MQRLCNAILFTVLVGCSPPAKPLRDVLPAQIDTWMRGSVAEVQNIPDLVTNSGIAESAQATYRGAGEITVRAFRMRADTSAFDLIQKWNQQQGLATYKGPYFVIANAEGADLAVVRSFVQQLQSQLP